MKILIAVVSVLTLVICVEGEAVAVRTNQVEQVAVCASTTNGTALKLPRQQCEAMTKSGTRCKRNAISGEKLCRQHLKSAFLKKPKSKGDVRLSK